MHNSVVTTPYLWDIDNPNGYGNRIGRYRTEVESEFMFAHIGKSPKRILDMGGGSGRFARMLVQCGHDVTLVDKNPQAVAMAMERGVQRAIACDILKFSGSDFDTVICMEVFQYFKNWDTLVSKAAECLNSSGTFVFCVTNSRSWRYRLRRLKNRSCEVHACAPREIANCLKSHRFEVAACKGFQWSLAQTGSDSFLVDASVWIEKGLGLDNWLSQSPWLLYACRKAD